MADQPFNVDEEQYQELYERQLDPPDPVIANMYLEITNIAQALNIGLLVMPLVDGQLMESAQQNLYSPIIFVLASVLITTIFWTRFHFDTTIIKRSYTVVSTFWFFAYTLAAGVNVSLVKQPAAWLISAGVVLFFGAGFYVFNLIEIRRKQVAKQLPNWSNFVRWQERRAVELFILSGLAIFAGIYVHGNRVLALLAGVFVLGVGVWQAFITNDYRRLRFIRTGS